VDIYSGAILLTQVTDFTFTQGLIISWVSYTAFTMYSGSRGVILTDTLMFLLFTSVAWRMIRKSYG
jgi:sodium/pantothenate symporter